MQFYDNTFVVILISYLNHTIISWWGVWVALCPAISSLNHRDLAWEGFATADINLSKIFQSRRSEQPHPNRRRKIFDHGGYPPVVVHHTTCDASMRDPQWDSRIFWTQPFLEVAKNKSGARRRLLNSSILHSIAWLYDPYVRWLHTIIGAPIKLWVRDISFDSLATCYH